MQPYFLGIDIGTGSTKAVAVCSNGKAIHTTQVYYETEVSPQGHSEQDPQIIWKAFVQCIRQTVSNLQQKPQAIALSSAMHSMMIVDDGAKPLSPLLTWADRRSTDVAESLKADPQAEEFYHQCGTPIHAMSPISKIIWWRKNEPELFRKAHKFIGIKEYIWHRLFQDFQIDHSLASATGMFAIESCTWYAPALAYAGIAAHQLSAPVATTYYRTDLPAAQASALHIRPNTPFIIGASDGCTANLGSSSLTDGTAAVTIGTSGAVRIATTHPVRVFKAQLFNYRLDETYFITGGPVNNGGAAVKWFVEQFFKDGKSRYNELLQDLFLLPPGSEGLIFLPYLMGERAPIWDSKSCGAFIGLTHSHTPLHCLKAVVEGVCFALNEVLHILEQNAPAVYTLHISGGFTQSQTAMQVLANITGKQICLMQTEDASAIGAAYLALKALGCIKSYNELPRQQVVRTFTPQPEEVQAYKEYFILYCSLYPVLSTSMHALYQLKNKQVVSPKEAG